MKIEPVVKMRLIDNLENFLTVESVVVADRSVWPMFSESTFMMELIRGQLKCSGRVIVSDIGIQNTICMIEEDRLEDIFVKRFGVSGLLESHNSLHSVQQVSFIYGVSVAIKEGIKGVL